MGSQAVRRRRWRVDRQAAHAQDAKGTESKGTLGEQVAGQVLRMKDA